MNNPKSKMLFRNYSCLYISCVAINLETTHHYSCIEGQKLGTRLQLLFSLKKSVMVCVGQRHTDRHIKIFKFYDSAVKCQRKIQIHYDGIGRRDFFTTFSFSIY